MENELHKIGSLLVDRNLNDVDLEGSEEEFGALLMIGHLRAKIYPILEKLYKTNVWEKK